MVICSKLTFAVSVIVVFVYCLPSEAVRTLCEPQLLDKPSPEVVIPEIGFITGVTTISYWKKRRIYQYLGIPYAEPPVKELRFKAPVAKKWTGRTQYSASTFKQKCPQLVNDEDTRHLAEAGDNGEDCLYLNVFIPENAPIQTQCGDQRKDHLPVMVFIHGGGFTQGSAHDFCSNYLLDEDVILVTFQYRLGSLGFMNLETDEIAGNMGLLDQLMVLEWVNQNIEYFGGDKNQVTLFGSSSGSAAVSLMLVSPIVKEGLFHQVILQSGNLLGTSWLYDFNPKKHALDYAEFLNCTGDTSTLVRCLRNKSTLEILQADVQIKSKLSVQDLQSEQDIQIGRVTMQNSGNLKFLTENPTEKFTHGIFKKVPIMIGVTKDEGSFLVGDFYNAAVNPYGNNSCLADDVCTPPYYLHAGIFYDLLSALGVKQDMAAVLELTKDIYFPKRVRGNLKMLAPGLIDLVSDVGIKMPTLQFARIASRFTPTYVYTFNYKGHLTKLGYGKKVYYPFSGGVAHSDDQIYLFPVENATMTQEELQVAKLMSNIWTSFATNKGNPKFADVSWAPMTSMFGPYLKISEEATVESDFTDEFAASTKE